MSKPYRRRRETPTPRTNPSGERVWRAIWTDVNGDRQNAGTYKLKRDAQDAIDAAYEAEQHELAAPEVETVGEFFETWIERYPRSDRTNKTNRSRVRGVLDGKIAGTPFRDWAFRDLRRKHAYELVDYMLVNRGLAYTGAQNVIRTLSAMAEDAITEDVAELNFATGVRVRANDARVRGKTRPPQVYSVEDMHRFAAACGNYEGAVRLLTDCGLRLGELLGLDRTDLDGATLRLRGNAYAGEFMPGDQPTKKHVREVPVPLPVVELLRARPARIDTALMFPTRVGTIWHESTFRRDVWRPAQEATGLQIRPHDCRHSYVSLLNAAGVDEADVADFAGHGLGVSRQRYRQALGRSADAVRAVFE